MELWIHVDCKHMPPTVDSLLEDIVGWESEGATGVVFEWENMFPYPNLGEAVRKDAYTPRDIERILDVCRRSGLKAVPLVQTFGHLEWLLSQPAYGAYREFDDYPSQIKACDDAATALLKSKIGALLKAHHDSPYIHLGADEAYRLTDVERSDCSAAREGACAVFMRHMKPLVDQVVESAKRPIIWADMPLRHPENIDMFPRELVFCDWLYSQTSDHAPAAHVWGCPSVTAQNYNEIPEARRLLFESYWRIGARDFPGEFYQFPYTPCLRDRGYDVLVGPATLYAGNALAATNLPNARANAGGWLRAADRFGAIGALNTCWSVRGAFREVTRAGHRAFLLQGRNLAAPLSDGEVSVACWQQAAGDRAATVARCVDELDPPLDDISRAHPYFDAARRTHRGLGYDRLRGKMYASLSEIEPGDVRVGEHRAAVERGIRSAETLGASDGGDEEIKAWRLGALEMVVRAEAWLAVWCRAGARPQIIDVNGLLSKIEAQSEAVRNFMHNRYMKADIDTVCEYRYDSLKKLLVADSKVR